MIQLLLSLGADLAIVCFAVAASVAGMTWHLRSRTEEMIPHLAEHGDTAEESNEARQHRRTL